MSQEHLGERLGLTFQQVQKYEKGANRISAGTLYQLGQILDVPVAFFYDGFDNGIGDESTETNGSGEGDGRSHSASESVDPLKDRRVLRLIRSWRSVPPKVQDEVLSLMSALSGSPEPLPEESLTAWTSEPRTTMPLGLEEESVLPKPPQDHGQDQGHGRRRRRGAIWDPADIKPIRSSRKA